MSPERYKFLYHAPDELAKLTGGEMRAGWHYCQEFDFLITDGEITDDDGVCICGFDRRKVTVPYTAIIMMGLPGSGKTTYAKNHFGGAVHCSADHYFETPEGYKYDAKLASVAHGQCFRNAIRAMEIGTNDVLIDNTNVNVHSIAPYVSLAHAFGYNPRILMVRGPGTPEETRLRSVHNVPEMVWNGMRSQLNEMLSKWPGIWPKLEVVNGF